ncbi:MAG: GDP-mannose 4,6-dehydratase [Prolixibacteraceae bacterium]
MKRALIVGIDGQLGYYLSELLVSLKYQVYGIGVAEHKERAKFLPFSKEVEISYPDMKHDGLPKRIVAEFRRSEIYILTPANAANDNGQGNFDQDLAGHNSFILRIMIENRLLNQDEWPRLFHACTCNLYGQTDSLPQDELTPLNFSLLSKDPVLKAYRYVHTFRNTFGLHASSGILFDYSSPYHFESCFPGYVSSMLCKIVLGKEEQLRVGDLLPRRDWGHAREYARAMYLALQQDFADDYVIASGVSVSREILIYHAARQLGLTIRFAGIKKDRRGYLTHIDIPLFKRKVGEPCLKSIQLKIVQDDLSKPDIPDIEKAIVVVDPAAYTSNEPFFLLGDYSKAKKQLNWSANLYLVDLMREMINSDLKRIKVGVKQS